MRVPARVAARLRRSARDADAIVARLASLGFPVDAIETRPALTNVVVGRIVNLGTHPNADRLQLCTLDTGDGAHADDRNRRDERCRRARSFRSRPSARTCRSRRSDRAKCAASIRRACCVRPTSSACRRSGSKTASCSSTRRFRWAPTSSPHFRLTEPVLDVDVTPNRPDALSIVGLARELGRGVRDRTALAAASIVDARRTAHDARVTIETVDCKRFVFPRVRRHARRPGRPDPHPARPRRTAADQQPGRHLELRDARARAAAALLRFRARAGGASDRARCPRRRALHDPRRPRARRSIRA